MAIASSAPVTRPAPLDFNPLGEAFRNQPTEFFPALHEASPGTIRLEGEQAAFVATYANCTEVLRDYRRFSSVRSKTTAMERIDFFNRTPVMPDSDPPVHTRLRRVVGGAFAPARVAHMRDVARNIAAGLLRDAGNGAPFDVVTQFAHPLTRELLLGHFLGVEREDFPVFINFQKSLPLLAAIKPGEGKPKEYLDCWETGLEYCGRIIERARRERSDNLIGLIVSAGDEEGRLSESEMLAMLLLLFTAGMTTLANHLSSAFLHLARRPEYLPGVAVDPGLALRFFEEVLRFDPGVLVSFRFPTADTDLDGVRLKAGSTVYVIHSAAGWDPKVFPQPERFDPDRPNVSSHLTFGHGIHSCIGNTIVRAVAPMLLGEVASRFPRMRLAEPDTPIAYHGTPRSRSPLAIPVRF